MKQTLLSVIFAATALQADAAPDLSYADIAGRLYNLKRLATPPTAGEKTGAATSADRAARYDADHELYLDWYANNDGSGFVRREGDSIIAAELEGPGVIWRIWSAKPEGGPIQFFIDDAEQPVLSVPFSKLFDAGSGPFSYSELVRDLAKGWNCFVPIPYQKSCRVVLGKGWGNYYQITHTRFPAGTTVPSFRGTLNDNEKAALTKANRVWTQRNAPLRAAGGEMIEKSFSLAPGESIEAARLESPRAIHGLICSVAEKETTAMERALRELTVSITWDGDAVPAVWAPLGDFFGSAPGFNPYHSLPCGMTREGMYASWYMPFEKAVVRISNEGTWPRTVNFKLMHEPLEQPAAALLRFHAKWHRDHWGQDGPGKYAKDRWPDWPVLKANNGSGRFCGIHLHLWNPLHAWDKDLLSRYQRKVSEICPVPDWFKKNVMPDYWWGEGDEKFFADGEKYPSTFGTGSEDYFGYAWGTPKFFDSATQCQTRNNGNTGHISVVRWHIADDVPFQSSFEACLEKYHGNNWPLHYAATAYWYQRAGVTDDYGPVPVTEREDYYTLPELLPAAPRIFAEGFFECEELKVLSQTPDIFVGPQDMSPWDANRRNNGTHLLVKAAKADDFVEVEIPAPDDKPRRLVLTATQAPDFAILAFTVNGQACPDTLDCYAPDVSPPAAVKLGLCTPQNGKFVLRARVARANAKATGPKFYFGLDAVGFEP